MGVENWTVETDAEDYFLHQQKKLETADRRPVIRKASQLAGPGIGPSATRVTNWSDLLATYNGYYSSAPGAVDAPNAVENFVGTVIMDSEFGGRQVLVGLASSQEFQRMFIRNPGDETSISWSSWRTDETITPAIQDGTIGTTSVPSGTITALNSPATVEMTPSIATFQRNSADISILRPGAYTGMFRVSSGSAITGSLRIEHPKANGMTVINLTGINYNVGYMYPLSFWTNLTSGFLRLSATQTSGAAVSVQWTMLSLTRVGGVS